MESEDMSDVVWAVQQPPAQVQIKIGRSASLRRSASLKVTYAYCSFTVFVGLYVYFLFIFRRILTIWKFIFVNVLHSTAANIANNEVRIDKNNSSRVPKHSWPFFSRSCRIILHSSQFVSVAWTGKNAE